MDRWDVAAAFLTLVCFGFSSAFRVTRSIHYFQLEEYQNARFLRWLFLNWRRILSLPEVALIPIFTIAALTLVNGTTAAVMWVSLATWAVVLAAVTVLRRTHPEIAKKPLVYTARVKRLLVCTAVIMLAEVFSAWALLPQLGRTPVSVAFSGARSPLLWLVIAITLSQLTPISVVLGNILAYPIEATMRVYYVRSAARKIKESRAVVIGITGSYGKTSTKEILAHILSTRYSVLKTPKSYNTLMGVCKVIRESLLPRHEYFVVELGAYGPGEIARLCNLVRPRIGILTAVGPQHLERFGTLEAVAQAKFELIQSLPPDGLAVFNADDPIVKSLSARSPVKTLRYSTCQIDGVDASTDQMVISSKGTCFVLKLHGRDCGQAQIAILGRHNVSNVLAAALVADECGITPRDIIHSIALLPQVEHRLQVSLSPSGVTYIDDAYNANPVGAAMALEVLGAFSGRKILVTPGLVELGHIEVEENVEFGRKAAAVCDIVILVGDSERTRAIESGLMDAGLDADRIRKSIDLNHAKKHLQDILVAGDVVLFENDLPDLY